ERVRKIKAQKKGERKAAFQNTYTQERRQCDLYHYVGGYVFSYRYEFM
ncbi:hypothetical protein CSUI_001238, partial [Cystoisospora suis]